MRTALIAAACLGCLAACEVPGPIDTPVGVDAKSDTLAGDVTQVDSGPTGPAGCTEAEIAACNDEDPCTVDNCAPAGLCSHKPALGTACNDNNPCTVADLCIEKGCKGTTKNCDDGSPCTTDVCQTSGECTHKPNQHYDCVPLIAVAHPPRGYRWSDPNGLLTVSGKVISQKARAAALTLQGKAVVFAADGTFSTQLQLTPGSTWLEFVATDDKGGTRKRVQGVHWSADWTKGSLPHGAIALGGQLPAAWQATNVDAWAGQCSAALAKAAFAVPAAYGGADAAVQWQFASSPAAMGVPGSAAVVGLAGQPVALAVAPALAATLAVDPGIPDLCVPHNLAADFANGAQAMQLVLTDRAWNAALRAAWLAGAGSGDITPATEGLDVKGMQLTALAWPMTPWLLRSCGATGGPVLELNDLRVHLRVTVPGDLEALLIEGNLHVAIRAQADWQSKGNHLELHIGPTLALAADLELLGKAFLETDIQEAVVADALKTAVPKLLDQWRKAALAQLPLPVTAQPGTAPVNWSWAAPQAVPGAVRLTALPQ